MSNYYIISDNQYFSLGVKTLIAGHACVSLLPEDIITGLRKVISGVVLIYVKDRRKFRRVCFHLSLSECELIFFFDPNQGLGIHDIVSYRFWNAKLSVRDLTNRIPKYLSYTSGDILENISPSRRRRLFIAAKGLKHFNSWILERTSNPKFVFSYKRSLLETLGIYSVSIHNLFLAEEISLAYVTVYKIQYQQMCLHQ